MLGKQGITRRIATAGFAGCMVALALGATPALAAWEGEWKAFKQCPLEDKSVEWCLASQTLSGEFVLGEGFKPPGSRERVTIPPVKITNPITLQGGYFEQKSGELKFVGAKNGETLSRSPQEVESLEKLLPPKDFPVEYEPCCFFKFHPRADYEQILNEYRAYLTIYATTELARPASQIGVSIKRFLKEKGVAVSLPVKIRLENALAGPECYIGSDSEPLWLNMTTGATKPQPPNKEIHGSKGRQEFNKEGNILLDTGDSLVENAFRVPGVAYAKQGCGQPVEVLIDKMIWPIELEEGWVERIATNGIDAIVGLPARDGYNTAQLSGNMELSTAEVVRERGER